MLINSKLESKLHQIGLSDKEAKVYLACLSLGQASAAEIAAYAKIKRPTTYVILEQLKKEGLLSSVEKEHSRGRKGRKTIYIAEVPDRLYDFFDRRRQEFENNLASLKNILPQLSELYKGKEKDRPLVRFFSGSEGINTLREYIANSKISFFYEITNLDLVNLYPAQFKKSAKMQKRNEQRLSKIDAKTLYYSKDITLPTPIDKWERKKLSFPTPNELVVSDNYIYIINFIPPEIFGILIEDKHIAQLHRVLFESLWEREVAVRE